MQPVPAPVWFPQLTKWSPNASLWQLRLQPSFPHYARTSVLSCRHFQLFCQFGLLAVSASMPLLKAFYCHPLISSYNILPILQGPSQVTSSMDTSLICPLDGFLP